MFIQNTYAQYPVLTTTSLTGNPTLDSNFLKSGNYAIDTNNERNQYVGLWRYENNEILFELKMEKRDQISLGGWLKGKLKTKTKAKREI